MSDVSGDVLIVGSGSAGSVLAEQLSVNPDCRVVVLEAGPGLDDPVVRTLTENGLQLPIGRGSPVIRRWQSRLTDHPPRTAEVVRGSCLGGSGAVNGGYFCRALPTDFDGPAIPGWSWDDVVEHYRAVEERIGVAPAREFGSDTEEFVDAALAAGYRWFPDLTDLDAPPGIAAVPLNISLVGDAMGRRRGPGAVFLEPALGRPNLSVLTGTRVIRVRIADGRAVGVDAIGPSGPVRLDADRVVLSAGALGSAQLLMLAGIGPADDLRAIGIPVVANLPVGQRCWDHPEWVMGTGRPSTGGRPVLEAVMVTDELEIRPYTIGFGGEPTKIGVALMRPRSSGRVTLTSAEPGAPLRIEHRYDSEPADQSALQAGCDLVGQIVGGDRELGSPSWSTSQHLCGTAPMGVGEHAVVDSQCRVLGVPGLWVVDGSVLPRIPRRGPHATIAMIGHRAAGFFKDFA